MLQSVIESFDCFTHLLTTLEFFQNVWSPTKYVSLHIYLCQNKFNAQYISFCQTINVDLCEITLSQTSKFLTTQRELQHSIFLQSFAYKVISNYCAINKAPQRWFSFLTNDHIIKNPHILELLIYLIWCNINFLQSKRGMLVSSIARDQITSQ